MRPARIVVIGNGMVGQRFLEQLVARSGERRNELEVTTFCEESRPAYDRVQLTSFFSGKTAEDLSLARREFFEEARLTVRLNDSVLGIDPARKVVRSVR